VAARTVSWLGIGFIAFGLFVLLVAIPFAVTSPSNVGRLVLSPTFWPTIIGWLIIVLGAMLVLLRWFRPAEPTIGDVEVLVDSATGGPWMRLAATAVIMVGLVLATPYLGLVWTSMLCFALLSVVIRAPQPVLSGAVAILLPLVLYAFFAHVAGVAVPQGEFIRLP
jgi:putative tricarboxylic transport membrane protein